MSQARNELAALARAAREHIQRAQMLGATLDHRMKDGAREASRRKEVWQPDDAWRSDFNVVQNALAQAGRALQQALESTAKRLGGMTIEQLEAQFKAELTRVANKFTDDDWVLLDKIRMKQVLSKVR